MDVALDDFGRGRTSDGGDVEHLTVLDQLGAEGVFIVPDLLGTVVDVAGIDQAKAAGGDLVDQKTLAGAEMAVQRFTAVGGAGDANGAGQIAFGVGLDVRQWLDSADTLAFEQRQGLFQRARVDVGKFGIGGGLQGLDGQCVELRRGGWQTDCICEYAQQARRVGVR